MKRFFTFVLFLAIIGGVAYFVIKNKDETGSVKKVTPSELGEDVLDSIKDGIYGGIESVEKGVLSGIAKVKNDVMSDSSENKEVEDYIGEIFKSGKKSTENALLTHETSIITGKLVIRGRGKDMTCYVKTGLLNQYKVITITGTEDSYRKLAGYNGKKIKISGLLNTETNEIIAATYRLASD